MDEKTLDSKRTFFESVKEFFKKDLVQYIVKRLLMFIPTLFLISILAFFVIQLPEIDYVDREIAKLAAFGMSNVEIADALHISLATVKQTIRIVFQKSGVNSRDKLITIL